MIKLNKFTLAASVIFLMAGIVGVLKATEKVYAQELLQDQAQTEQTDNQEQPADNQNTNESPATYDYTAQPGDSYTLMARKAVQTYGVNNNVNLNGAQIIFAETNITQEAGSPLLNLGEKVQISESVVKSWVEKAQSLTESQQAAWGQYTGGVNFNTNAVGQVVS